MELQRLVLSWCLVSALAGGVTAQEWARKMFEEHTHDFGTVARGAVASYSFKLKNIYKETIHIASVRASCRCSIPSISKETLETWEEGTIDVEYNTRQFIGDRGATITVTIDRPYRAEVQLRVRGFIRGDVIFNPGSVQLGEVDEGRSKETRVQVSHSGRSNWEIIDVQSANQHFEVEMKRLATGGAKSTYDLLVRLKESAPPGYLNDQLVVVTNDRAAREIPLLVEGRVVPEISVQPQFYLGELTVGETVTKQLVIKGKRAFRIVDITCEDGCFSFEKNEEPKKLHIVRVTFTPNHPGRVAQTIHITTATDRRTNAQASFEAYASVSSDVVPVDRTTQVER